MPKPSKELLSSSQYSEPELLAGIAVLVERLDACCDKGVIKRIAKEKGVPAVFQSRRFVKICSSFYECTTTFGKFDFVAYARKHVGELLAIVNSNKRISKRQFKAEVMKQVESDWVVQLGYEPGKEAVLDAALKRVNAYSFDAYILRAMVAKGQLYRALGGKLALEHMYRLVIDGCDERCGDYYYENEPGYLSATLGAWAKYFKQPVAMSRQGYEALYQDITAGMNFGAGYRSTPLDHFHSREYCAIGMSADAFGVDDVCRLAGLRDAEPMSLQSFHYQLRMATKMSHVDKAQQLFDIANAALAKKPKPNAAHRLLIYVWLARELELHHLFSDGNGRSTTLLLSSLVHHDPDMPDLMFYNPNLLDLNGPLKLAGHVLDAMQRFADVPGATAETTAVISALQKQLELLAQKDRLCTWSSVVASFDLDESFIARSETARALMQFSELDDQWYAICSAIVVDDHKEFSNAVKSSNLLKDPVSVHTLFQRVLEVGGPRCLEVILSIAKGRLMYPRLYKLAQSFTYPSKVLRDTMFERFYDQDSLDIGFKQVVRMSKLCRGYMPPVRNLNSATGAVAAVPTVEHMTDDQVPGGAGGGAGAVAATTAQGLFRTSNGLGSPGAVITSDGADRMTVATQQY